MKLGQLSIDLPFEALTSSQRVQVLHGFGTKHGPTAVREDGADLVDIVRHHAIEDAVGSRGVVAHAAAHGGPIPAGRVRSQHQAVASHLPVEGGHADPRLGAHPAGLRVHGLDTVHVFAEVHHQRRAHGLSGQGTARAPGQDGDAVAGRNLHRGLHIVGVLGDHHAHGHDLEEAGVRAVEHTGEAVKAHLPGQDPAQFRGQVGVGIGHGAHVLGRKGGRRGELGGHGSLLGRVNTGGGEICAILDQSDRPAGGRTHQTEESTC